MNGALFFLHRLWKTFSILLYSFQAFYLVIADPLSHERVRYYAQAFPGVLISVHDRLLEYALISHPLVTDSFFLEIILLPANKPERLKIVFHLVVSSKCCHTKKSYLITLRKFICKYQKHIKRSEWFHLTFDMVSIIKIKIFCAKERFFI